MVMAPIILKPGAFVVSARRPDEVSGWCRTGERARLAHQPVEFADLVEALEQSLAVGTAELVDGGAQAGFLVPSRRPVDVVAADTGHHAALREVAARLGVNRLACPGLGRIARAFRPPLRYDQVATAGFCDDAGLCQDCDAPYCYRHWHVSETGYGHCPAGHGKSLDPH
jgi:hypothetical protein